MITLYQPPPVWGLPNASPFCMKLETYLRMARVPFAVDHNFNPFKAPTGKMPYIAIDGRMMGDSGLIISHLEARAAEPLDAWLSPEQKARGLAIQRMLEEHLYFGLAYSRWAIDAHWQMVREAYFGRMPLVLRGLLPGLLRKKTMGVFKGQGIGRHRLEDIYALCAEDIRALDLLLGEQAFLLGDRPASIDACAYAFLANLIWAPIEDPLKREALAHPRLEAYCRRIKAAYYQDQSLPPAVT